MTAGSLLDIRKKALAAEVEALPYHLPLVASVKFKILHEAAQMIDIDFWAVVEQFLGFDGMVRLIRTLREAAKLKKERAA